MIGGTFTMMMNIVRAYVDADFKLCTPLHLVCTLNYNSGGYNCIVKVTKQDHIRLNILISEHDVGIKLLKKFSLHTNYFNFNRDQKSMKFWSYSRTQVPGLFSYDNCR